MAGPREDGGASIPYCTLWKSSSTSDLDSLIAKQSYQASSMLTDTCATSEVALRLGLLGVDVDYAFLGVGSDGNPSLRQ